MPLLNYTTQVDVWRTVSEIQGMLAKAGARAISVQYDAERQPAALAFEIDIGARVMAFRLPSRWQAVHKLLQEDAKVPARLTQPGQARRVAWRIVKNWVEAQLAIIEAEMVVLPEVFLPYAIIPSGKTVWEEIAAGNTQLLDSGL